MTLAAVSDAGPLIHLAEIDSLELLSTFDTLIVPETVYKEVEAGGVPDELADRSYELVEADQSRVGVEELDAGGRAAIAVAKEQGVVLGRVKLGTRRLMFECSMSEFNRLGESTEWIDLEFVERERTPRSAIQVGIQLHLAGLSLSNTKQHLERLGVDRSRTAIHDWVRKADLQPDSDVDPDQIAVDETLIRVNGQRHWLFAAVDPESNQYLHVRLFQTRKTQLTVLFLRELREKQ